MKKNIKPSTFEPVILVPLLMIQPIKDVMQAMNCNVRIGNITEVLDDVFRTTDLNKKNGTCYWAFMPDHDNMWFMEQPKNSPATVHFLQDQDSI